jgi:hypothetical protein
MAFALEPVRECDILRRRAELTFTDGTYSYRITRNGDRSIYRVTDGKETIEVSLSWAFGLGAAGQTYVFERNGHHYESRVSYFRAIDRLDFTLGAAGARPANLEDAAGRLMTTKDSTDCFSCHATGAVSHGSLDLAHMKPGILCERCHGDATQHVASFQAAKPSLGGMPRLGQSSAEEMSNFCGQCHRTWAQIAAEGPFGINNVRFQPYRLTNSKCYDAGDRRISCSACHDPHADVVRNTASYDSKCQACHGGGHVSAKACPTAKSNCASCHMPKLELPGSHNKFTDHQIRIVKANEKYPN